MACEMAFGGGDGAGANTDCCSSNPANYKVVGDLPGGRMVEMTLAAGCGDVAHDHPVHYLYVIEGGTLKLCPPPGATEGEAEIPMTSGAAMVIPAGPHQVTNVGETNVKILFVEPARERQEGALEGALISPMAVSPECYKVVAEDDDWFIAEMELAAGCEDEPHSHMDHFVYVLEGETQVTIFPGLEKTDMKKEVDMKPGMCLPIHAGHHIVCNSGEEKFKCLIFELKQKCCPPKESVPAEYAPVECSDKETAPVECVEKETTPAECVEKETAPVECVEKETEPAECVEKETAPAECVEKETAPAECVEKETPPAECVEKETAPAECVEKETAPAECVEKETASAECVEKETAPAECAAKDPPKSVRNHSVANPPKQSVSKENPPATESVPKQHPPTETPPAETTPKKTKLCTLL